MNKKIKIYAEQLEETALEQFTSAMDCDYAVQGALMPDAHTGYGLPIGAVVSTKGVIVPSWVGYDIGCGMCAIPTTFDVEAIRKNSDNIFERIYKHVPVGFNVHEHPQESTLSPDDLSERGVEQFNKRKGFRHLGTLGGGNHFIEIGNDEDDVVWIIVHCGSRGVGHGIAQAYMRIASGTGKASEGHFPLAEDSQEGIDYINDLAWGLEFALQNRRMILKEVECAIFEVCSGGLRWDGLINRNHNHAEKKDGLWIHRKGATHAEEGMMGVIPGNMRDGSFIVRGKGNPDSMCSSSHGAGRVLGRKRAKEELDVDTFSSQMTGITAKVGESTLDESPSAYKNIFDVMELQKDLIDVVCHVKPIINIKG